VRSIRPSCPARGKGIPHSRRHRRGEPAVKWGILPPPAPHWDRFTAPTSVVLIGPTLRRLFKRLGADLCSRGVRLLRTLSDGAGGFLPGVPFESWTREIVTFEAPAHAVRRAYQSHVRIQRRPQRRRSRNYGYSTLTNVSVATISRSKVFTFVGAVLIVRILSLISK
jgi:hypothetical protein